MEKLYICLPSYNEAENLPELIGDIGKTTPNAKLVVVDDGSTDLTGDIAEKAGAKMNLVVVRHPRNMGLAQAMKTAFDHVLHEADDEALIVVMDADGSHRPEQIPKLVEKANEGADLVVAGRYIDGAEVRGVSPLRRVLSYGTRQLTQLIFGRLGARDVSCGYRLYRSSLLREAKEAYGDNLIVSEGFSVNVELLIKLSKIGAVIEQTPLDLRYDLKKGRSKIRILPTIFQYLKLFAQMILHPPGPRKIAQNKKGSEKNT